MIEHPLLRVVPVRFDFRPARPAARSPRKPSWAMSPRLPQRLPRRGHVVNLCRDRYRFAVGFAAALCRRQVNLLPPNDTPACSTSSPPDYPDVYCLTDAQRGRTVPRFHYPSDLTLTLQPADDSALSRRSAGGGAVHLGLHRTCRSRMAGAGANWSTARWQRAGGSALLPGKGRRCSAPYRISTATDSNPC